MTRQEKTRMIVEAMHDAGYVGDVTTLRGRAKHGHTQTLITSPSDDLYVYLVGYLGNDAHVTQHPITKTITVEWL